MTNLTTNGTTRRPLYDLLGDVVAARAAEIVVEREAQRLADE
jgi:hypothetical protein